MTGIGADLVEPLSRAFPKPINGKTFDDRASVCSLLPAESCATGCAQEISTDGVDPRID